MAQGSGCAILAFAPAFALFLTLRTTLLLSLNLSFNPSLVLSRELAVHSEVMASRVCRGLRA